MTSDDGFGPRWHATLDETVAVHQRWRESSDAAARAARVVRDAALSGRQVLTFGNGGSATDAQHLAAELVVRFVATRRAIAAVALTADSAVVTAAGNDLGFEQIFARQIEALGREGDVAVGFSTSGRSPNVLAALRVARWKGLHAVALTGQDGLADDEAADIVVAVPSAVTARIQEAHRTWMHAVCGWVEESLHA